MIDCDFCQFDRTEDIIYETDNFLVIVGLGIIAPGHVMVLIKKHLSCMIAMDDSLANEYFTLHERLHNRIAQVFAEPFMVEYGAWGQSIPHAHVHFIPLKSKDYEVNSIMEAMVLTGNNNVEETTWEDLKGIYSREGKYVSFEEYGKLYAIHIHKSESEEYNSDNRCHIFYRQFFADYKELRGVKTWREITAEDKVIDEQKRKITRERLRGL